MFIICFCCVKNRAERLKIEFNPENMKKSYDSRRKSYFEDIKKRLFLINFYQKYMEDDNIDIIMYPTVPILPPKIFQGNLEDVKDHQKFETEKKNLKKRKKNWKKEKWMDFQIFVFFNYFFVFN